MRIFFGTERDPSEVRGWAERRLVPLRVYIMPTSSVASAGLHGTLIASKVMGRAPSAGRKPQQVGSAPSFPGRSREPGKDHQRSRTAMLADQARRAVPAPETEASPLEATSWGASDPAIRSQLERELSAIRKQLEMRQEIAAGRQKLAALEEPSSSLLGHDLRWNDPAMSDNNSDVSDSRPPSAASRYAPPPPRDKEAERTAKKVKALEAVIVRKLIARTPLGGPTGAGALKTLTKAFEYYDAEGDGSVDVASLSRVLAKLNVITELPPPPKEKEAIDALFYKHARKTGGELVYATFARELLYEAGTLVPAAEVMAENDRQKWQYDTAVNQALARRNLEHSTARPPDPGPRDAWADGSAAAKHKEERLSHYVVPRKDVDGAAQRGRLQGGVAGYQEYRRLVNTASRQAKDARAQDAVDGAALRQAERDADDSRRSEALADWRKTDEQNRLLMGMAPGQAAAAARRRRG